MSIPQLDTDEEKLVNFVFRHNFENKEQAIDMVRQINENVVGLKADQQSLFNPREPIRQLKEGFALQLKDKGIDEITDQELLELVKYQPMENEAATVKRIAEISGDARASTLVQAYRNIVAQQATDLMDDANGGMVALVLKGDAATAVEELTETMLEEMSGQGDTKLQRLTFRILGIGKSGAVLTPAMDKDAARLALQVESVIDPNKGIVHDVTQMVPDEILEQASLMDDAEEAEALISKHRQAAIAAAVENDETLLQAGTISERQAERQVVQAHADEGQRAFREFVELSGRYTTGFKLSQQRSIARESGNRAKELIYAGAEFAEKNKKVALIGAAAIGVGVLFARRKNKSDQQALYDEVLEMGEPQQEQRRFGAQDALLNARKYKTTADPLATAGVVGNLDRNKISHHNMSARKNDHLFKG